MSFYREFSVAQHEIDRACYQSDGEAQFWHDAMHPAPRPPATDVNPFVCPEVRHYQREPIEGAVIVTYEQRQPGATCWEPVTIFRPDPEALVPCRQCGEHVPARSLSAGLCAPCLWPAGD